MKRLLTAAAWGLAAFVVVAFPSIPRRLAATVEACDEFRPSDPLWSEEVAALAAEREDGASAEDLFLWATEPALGGMDR